MSDKIVKATMYGMENFSKKVPTTAKIWRELAPFVKNEVVPKEKWSKAVGEYKIPIPPGYGDVANKDISIWTLKSILQQTAQKLNS